MTPTVFLLPALLAIALCWRSHLLTCVAVMSLFGGTAAAYVGALGGAPITPVLLTIPFLALRAWKAGGGRAFEEVALDRPGLWLLVFALFAVLTALVLPRLFEGRIYGFTTSRTVFGRDMEPQPLEPIARNINQSVYVVASLVVYLSTRVLLRSDRHLTGFKRAVIALAIGNCVLAAVNIGELYLGLPNVLGYFRNATYAILESSIDGPGLRRITGVFPEASAFAGATLPMFAFTFYLWRHDKGSRVCGPLSVSLLVLLVISTSSTALVGVAGYLAIYAIDKFRSSVGTAEPIRIGGMTLILGFVVVAGCLVLLLSPELSNATANYLEGAVFTKLESSSGVERSLWNRTAWGNLLESYGLGVGLGTVHASSFPLVLLSNVGVGGALLFVAFLVSTASPVRGRVVDTQERVVMRAAVHAALATLIGASIAGRVFDLGAMFYLYAAAAAGTGKSSHG